MTVERNVSPHRDAAIHAALDALWLDAPRGVDARPEVTQPDGSASGHEVQQRVARIWAQLPELRDRPAYASLLGRPTFRERAMPIRRLAVAGLVAACVFLLLVVPGALWEPPHRFLTARAQTQSIDLDDGSHVTLGPLSRLDAGFNERARSVALLEGEAFFAVARNSARPFIVRAGNVEIVVLGTKFNVQRIGNEVHVLVKEGTVRVTRQDGERSLATSAILAAGQEAVTADVSGSSAPIEISSPGPAAAGTWRDGQLSYRNLSLGEIVADINRYLPVEIRIASPRAARMRLTTTFRVDQVDAFLGTVETALLLKIRRDSSGAATILERP